MKMIMSSSVEIITQESVETFALARRFSKCLDAGDVVALYGELGAGKTVFAQGVCRGLEVSEYVTSPTFTLVQEYHGRLPVYHVDFYRLNTSAEIEYLDLDMVFDSGGVTLIEWAEKGDNLLLEDRYTMHIETAEKGRETWRKLRITGLRGKDLKDCLP